MSIPQDFVAKLGKSTASLAEFKNSSTTKLNLWLTTDKFSDHQIFPQYNSNNTLKLPFVSVQLQFFKLLLKTQVDQKVSPNASTQSQSTVKDAQIERHNA